jgi:hypothetical protein
MHIKIQVIISDGDQMVTEEVAHFDRHDLSEATLGLTLKESKHITSGIQYTIAMNQVKQYIAQHRACPSCNQPRHIKDYHKLIYRTLFGKLALKSARLYECSCQQKTQLSFSPLAAALSGRVAPELRYLEAKWASLMSYGMTTKLLEEVFPVALSASSVQNNTHQVAQRLEEELEDEQLMFIDGCPYEWENLPIPDAPIIVAIDGGYVHAREGKNRKAGWFEVIVGKSMQDRETPAVKINQPEQENLVNQTKNQSPLAAEVPAFSQSKPVVDTPKIIKRFGYVVNYDTKPKRRLYEMLKNQGMQMNQAITFLSDGGDDVRDLQFYLSPESEHLLDWFHITMRLTVMLQVAKEMPIDEYSNPPKELERVKWYLWHGNVFRALKVLELLSFLLDPESKNSKESKLLQLLEEFYTYIENNQALIPNYGDRYHYGEAISTAFVESTVNELVSKRMVKKQQMRWTKKGAHLLLQVRVKALNDELRSSFCHWYPNMDQGDETILPLAA